MDRAACLKAAEQCVDMQIIIRQHSIAQKLTMLHFDSGWSMLALCGPSQVSPPMIRRRGAGDLYVGAVDCSGLLLKCQHELCLRSRSHLHVSLPWVLIHHLYEI